MAGDQYEKELRRWRKEHLRRIREQQYRFWQPCWNSNCPACVITGTNLGHVLNVHNSIFFNR
jgi:hypothetical protein